MNESYFTDRELTRDLYIRLPTGSVFVATDRDKQILYIFDMDDDDGREVGWSFITDDPRACNCHCFETRGHFEAWQKKTGQVG